MVRRKSTKELFKCQKEEEDTTKYTKPLAADDVLFNWFVVSLELKWGYTRVTLFHKYGAYPLVTGGECHLQRCRTPLKAIGLET